MEMDGVAKIYDKFEKRLEDILQDPCEPPVPLPLEFLRAITDDFSNKNEIGRGGYGVVYKGILRSGKIIAVKKIKETYPMMDKDSWSDELNRLIGIMHENIVQLIGYCADNSMETITDSGRLVVAEYRSRFICFEYLSNGSLDKYISSEHLDLYWDKIYAIIEGICRGLHFLHEEKVVHLDLKPENILMDDDMMPKIVDFGVARLLGEQKSKTYTQMPTGTLGYMAPEYRIWGKISPKADIFSLGVIMIEIITGSRNHPRSSLPYSMISNELNSPNNNTQARLQQFTEDVLRKWRKKFETSTNDASVVDVYTHQLEQLIDIALRCTDIDENKRPDMADILHFFSLGEAERSPCDSSRMSHQVRELLIVQPTELNIPLAGPEKCRSSCLLHLNNNTDGHVAFRILSNSLLRYFIWPTFHFVPPGCRFTIAVTIRSQQQNPQPSKDQILTLESAKASNQDLSYVISRGLLNDHERFFTKARDRRRQVQEEKLTYAYVGSEPDIMIIPVELPASHPADYMDVHPTEPWILIRPEKTQFLIWDYNSKDMVPFPELKNTRNEGSITWVAKFLAREKWIVAGCSSGYIKVYSYMTRRNLEGSKTILFAEIKSFKAHEYGDVLHLDIHPTGPYVLSGASRLFSGEDAPFWGNPMDKLKLWDWEKGWKPICTFNTANEVLQVKFNVHDDSTFVTICCPHRRIPDTSSFVKVWNTCSADSESKLPDTAGAKFLDFFSRDGKLYMIIAHGNGRKATIWDYHSMTCVTTLRGHTSNFTVAISHPELPILFTGSIDGTVCLWNSTTFSLMGMLNCGIGTVRSIACLKGSRRIAILHKNGLAITEIDHDQSGAVVFGRPYQSSEASNNAGGC